MNRSVSIVVSSILTWILSAGAPTSAQVERDLSTYATIGPFTIRGPIIQKDDVTELREFLWAKWQERQQAHVHVTWVGREGQLSLVDYFIDDTGDDRWRLTIQAAHANGRVVGVDEDTGFPQYDSVLEMRTDVFDRVLRTDDTSGYLLPSADEEGRSYKLEFVNTETGERLTL